MQLFSIGVLVSLLAIIYILSQTVNSYFGRKHLEIMDELLKAQEDLLREQINKLEDEVRELRSMIINNHEDFKNFVAESETDLNTLEGRITNRLIRLEGANSIHLSNG